MHAQVDQRATTGHLLAGEPTPKSRNTATAHPVRLGVVDTAKTTFLDMLLEHDRVAAPPIIEGDT